MNTEQSYKYLLDNILSKLGLKFAHYSSIDPASHIEIHSIQFDDEYKYVLLDEQNRHVVCWCGTGQYLFAYSFKNEKSLINSILNETEKFCLVNDNNIKIDNPCFGCKSLEEALIKLDLNDSNKNLEI